MRKLIFAFSAILFFNSCETDQTSYNQKSNELDSLFDVKSNSKKELAKAFAILLNENESFRNLIRLKALEQFDNDTEILLLQILDLPLDNGLTVEENLQSIVSNDEVVSEIKNSFPDLTILVPTLPNNSFSASKWDVTNQVPKVAVRLSNTNNVPVFGVDEQFVLESKYVPDFPVIVLKGNERVVFIKNFSKYKSLKTREVKVSSGVSFKFLDDCFDRKKNIVARTVNGQFLDSKLKSAYTIYNNIDGWQRDYIYYDITPSSPNGNFKYDFQESIKSFTLYGPTVPMYNKIADQTGDPRYVESYFISSSHWSGGNFEFKIRTIVNAKNGVGLEIIKFMNVMPNDIFDLKYSSVYLFGKPTKYFKLESVGFKTLDVNIPIFNWELDEYATSIKIQVEEVDLTETTVITDSRNVKFATNFNIDVALGQKVKTGLKFGASLEESILHSTQITKTEGNDILGDVIVNFADKVITGQNGNDYITRDYNSGNYVITIEPTRVQ
ncbi:hypothetical protein [Flavobacterium sp. GCM10027622]|uniref:hypothetical protein n=1 Tax=unclassified Flavobacterium TaxID=196869 RepID=UPI0036124FBE